jgi:DNA-binding CsgD family transcriptional regulator
MDHGRKLLYSEFFAQLQSAQDLLAEQLSVCLVLVDRDGREVTLPSGLPLVCHQHEGDRSGCEACHAGLIRQLSPAREYVARPCPQKLFVAALETSILTEDGTLYLLAGRTPERTGTESKLDLLRSLYTLPFATPFVAKKASGGLKEPASPQAALTPQEQKVLACLVAGQSNKDIAGQLCISQSTVKAHVANILKKLHLSNRTEASVYALKNGMNLGDDLG